MASLIVKQHETEYPNTAAKGNFVPPNRPGKTIEHQSMEVQVANNINMQSIYNVELGIPALPPHLKKATVFKEMTRTLFSIPVVCDGWMEATFRKKYIVVKDQTNKVVLTGIQDTETPLWLIPIGEKN